MMMSQGIGMLNGISLASVIGLGLDCVATRCPEEACCLEVRGGTSPQLSIGQGSSLVVKNTASSGSLDDGKKGHVAMDP